MQKTIEREINKIDKMILQLEQTQNEKLISEIILQIYCNLISTEQNLPINKYTPILKEKLHKLLTIIKNSYEEEKNRTFALKLYREILELQKEYPQLKEKLIEEINMIIPNEQNVEIIK